MDPNELISHPNAQKVNKLAKRVSGYSLDLENITENKAKKLQKNLMNKLKFMKLNLVVKHKQVKSITK